MSDLPHGLYELLKTAELEDRLTEIGARAALENLTVETGVRHLAHALTEQISDILAEVGSNGGNNEEKLNRQVQLLNQLLTHARQLAQVESLPNPISTPPQILRSISPLHQSLELPTIGLAQPWLFTSGKDSPALLHELQSELKSCDRVDILVSFITISGVRKIIDTLKRITALDAEGRSNTQLRIITTTYIGATDQKALDQLASLPNTEVKVSLDGRRTRLHAKAWIFERNTGFGSAYVGSANLSGAALMGGLEWTVKFTERGQNALFNRAKTHFETLWQDEEFQTYDPQNKEHQHALRAALVREKGSDYDVVQGITTFFDIQPKPFQRIMLDQLENERAHGRLRNLLVAATGTGKTVMAAFDYKRLCEREGGQPRLLFVAHRREILQQALHTYRHVLRDGNFGELLTGQHQPQHYTHVFTTIQSALSQQLIEAHGSDYWRVVVIDECHHIAANSFVQFVQAIQPKYLLGLTATPERSDDRSIFTHFDMRPDGSPSAQLRLWHALDQQLLAPFEYYACADGTDYQNVPWRQAGEIAALDNLLTGNEVRARAIINAWQGLVSNIAECRALAFCVTISHAEYMTQMFNKAGIRAACITGNASALERQQLPLQLERREINVLVTVDLYNEGVDLPFVDTLLLLRPTQSATLFQQQIGRGLRLHDGKESCLVLDFVGNSTGNFRFDVLYSAITGLSRKEIIQGVEDGFGKLPMGCHIQLQNQAREQVLASLREAVNFSWNRLAQELSHYLARVENREVTLSQFLRDQELDIQDVYRAATGTGNTGWTILKRTAGLFSNEITPDLINEEKYFSRRFGALLHIDDIEHISVLRAIGNSKGELKVSESSYYRLLMLCYQLVGGRGAVTIEGVLNRLRQVPQVCGEIVELADYLDSKTTRVFKDLLGLESTPLKLHSAYFIREILSAIGYYTETVATPFQAGVLRLEQNKTELLFVTLDKSEALHEGIAYDDYAISRSLFHWQSQNTAGPNTPSGRRYIEQQQNGWQFQLFVRENKTSPYRSCGPIDFVDYQGERPMNITWKLRQRLPDELFQAFSIIRG
ncbi:MAG: DUF3427 domain-containing protein [Idiomarina sp.]|nr:DUF3427 domain-containing protein [Idiomarina sp.]